MNRSFGLCAQCLSHLISATFASGLHCCCGIQSSNNTVFFFSAPQHKIISKIQSRICSVSIRLRVGHCSPAITPAVPEVQRVLCSLYCVVGKHVFTKYIQAVRSNAIKLLQTFCYDLVVTCVNL